jgi:hypothetical protein
MQATSTSSSSSTATPSLSELATFIAQIIHEIQLKKRIFSVFSLPPIFCIIQRGSSNISPTCDVVLRFASFSFLFFSVYLN